MLFTHFGISGPLVLSASSLMDFRENGKEDHREYELVLNLKPALTAEQLTARIGREFADAPARTLSNIMRRFFPARLSDVMASLSGMDPARKASSFSEKEMRELAELMQAVKMTAVRSRGFNEAIITRGGVSTREVDPYTMGSKLVSGLYFAGELLDVNAQTGGYNLQIAWSTGHLAGKAASEEA